MRTSKHSFFRTICSFLVNGVGKSVALIEFQRQIARERKALARLSDDQLRDIGLSRKDALRESSRSVFEIPANRLKRKRLQRTDLAKMSSRPNRNQC